MSSRQRQNFWKTIDKRCGDNPNIEKSIFNSIHAVCLDTMPGYKYRGTAHSFLDDYDKRQIYGDDLSIFKQDTTPLPRGEISLDDL